MTASWSSTNTAAEGTRQPQRRRNDQMRDASSNASANEAASKFKPHQLASHSATQAASKFKPYHAVAVPRRETFQNVETDQTSKPKTTAMLRNIPNRYTQRSLMQEIDEAGFQGSYNFFYLPMDTQNRTNVGYAFINFVQPVDLLRFAEAFSGYSFKDHGSRKIARVSPAHLQGFEENVAHFSKSAVSHSKFSEYRPVILHNGVEADRSEKHAVAAPQPASKEKSAEKSASTLKATAEEKSAQKLASSLKATAEEFVPAAMQARTATHTQLLATHQLPSPGQRPTLSTTPTCQYDAPQKVDLISQTPCCQYGVPQKVDLTSGTQQEQSYFSAKLDLEMALFTLLQQKRQVSDVSGTSSTEAASQGESSSSSSPRSASPLAGYTLPDCSEAKLNFPPGLWPDESLESRSL